jgi:hypothetical protein
MDGAGGDEYEIAGPDRAPVHQFLDRAVERRLPKLILGDLAREPEAERRARLRVEDVPAFALALGKAARLRLIVVRVDLDRQPLAGEDVFRQQRELAPPR